MRSLLLMLLIGGTVLAEESPRGWTDTSGRKFEGSYVSATPGKVSIRRSTDGKVFEVERAKLSPDDLAYLDSVGTRRGPEDFGRRHDHAGPMLEGYDESQANFTAPWPQGAGIATPPVVTVVEQNAAEHRFIYECPHFRIQCDVPLSGSLPVEIASAFEACYQAQHDLPLNNRRTRSPGAPKLRVFLYRTIDDFRTAGGLPGTVGSYLAPGDRLLIPLEGLGVKKSNSGPAAGTDFDFSAGFHNVYHEMSHLLWADIGNMAGVWMSEGLAEYLACAPYSNGRFDLASLPDRAIEFAVGGRKGVASRSLGKDIVMPHLQEFMGLTQPEFYKDPNRNYGLGLLLACYFIQLDGGGGGARFKAAIKACQEGGREDATQALLGGRDFATLEKNFVAGMRTKGVRITFKDPDGEANPGRDRSLK